MPHSSVVETIEFLRARYPTTPFLALGQTALWDEPVKAAWRMLLDNHWPEATMIAGIHDTDYFAKTTALVSSDDPYMLLPHNDGATRGLWSAAGELSAFLGSEDVPTRAMYERHGISFNNLAETWPGGKPRFYEDNTAAWGWRAIVHTGAEPPIARDVPLRDIRAVLIEQLDWGFGLSLDGIDTEHKESAKVQLEEVRAWVTSCLESCADDETLADLYRKLLPLFYAKLLGSPPSATEYTQTFELMRFTAKTAHLPRFDFVNNFLSVSMRDAARDAYDSAVTGGGMYGLETFGDGALPFDVVAAGRGRGTLLVTDDAVTVDFRDNPLHITGGSRPTDVAELAAALELALGENIALVGKAVSLISMLAGEFIVLFHETASGYTPRSAAMNEKILAAGGAVNSLPIVRLQYPTWDALATAGIETGFRLPAHIARSFESASAPIAAQDFGRKWRDVVAWQRQQLDDLKKARSVRESIQLVEEPDGDACWPCIRDQYEQALTLLKANAAAAAATKQPAQSLRDNIRRRSAERVQLERAKGEHYRNTVAPLATQIESTPEETSRAAREQIALELHNRKAQFDGPIEAIQNENRAARRQLKRLRAQKQSIERSPEAIAAPTVIADLTRQVQTARLSRVHDAFVTAESLPHTNSRPSAWWLSMVDPSGAWFRAIVEGTQARLEEI